MDRLSKARQFLEDFCNDHTEDLDDRSALPFRLTTDCFTLAEVEGECLEWIVQYLISCKCPESIGTTLARKVVDDILNSDLSEYMESEDQVDESPALEGDSTKPNQEEKIFPRRMDSRGIMRLACNKLYVLCRTWQENGIPLKHPPASLSLDVSDYAIKNTRRRMEDRHTIIGDFNTLYGVKDQPVQSFFAVFDGHAGVDAAIYAETHLGCNLARNESLSSDPCKALKEAFKMTDDRFVLRAQQDHLQSGSTGVCALVRKDQLYISWLGDSQALLVRAGEPVEVMDPHKPEREDERERIEKLGGCVVWFGAWRVNGTLSVSRAIGDPAHKPYISGDADVVHMELDGTEDFLILACDGFWDSIPPQMAVDHLKRHIQNTKDRDSAAQMLVKEAREQGSNDNISVIIIFLSPSQDSDDVNKKDVSVIQGVGDLNVNVNEEQHSNSSASKQPSTESSENKIPTNNGNKGDGTTDSDDPSYNMAIDRYNVHLAKSDSQRPLLSSGCLSSKSNSPKLILHDRHSPDCSKSSQKPMLSGDGGGSLSTSQSDKLVTSDSCDSGSISSTADGKLGPPPALEVHSDTTSNSDLVLISKTATRCINNRRSKRSKNGRNGRNKESKRSAHKARLNNSNQLAIGTAGRTPMRSKSTESDLSLAQRNMLRAGDQIFELLTGCSPNVIRKVKSPGKWTVAMEIENASSMFEEPAHYIVKERRRSDITVSYSNKK